LNCQYINFKVWQMNFANYNNGTKEHKNKNKNKEIILRIIRRDEES